MLPQSLNVALKEWAVLCAAIESGGQIILLRKGGISESIGGFEIEYRQFLLFPTYVHQNANMLKPSERGNITPADSEPKTLKITSAAEITDIVKMPGRPVMDSLDDTHIWSSDLIDMRFNYRPMNPLYLLIVRGYRLAEPVTIHNLPEYAGCKSWVPLERPIAFEAVPALSETEFENRRRTILDRIESGKETHGRALS